MAGGAAGGHAAPSGPPRKPKPAAAYQRLAEQVVEGPMAGHEFISLTDIVHHIRAM